MLIKKFKKGCALFITVLFIISNFSSLLLAAKVDPKKFPLGSVEIRALAPGGTAACEGAVFIAKEKGFFEEQGIDVTLVSGDFEVTKAGLQKGSFPIGTNDIPIFMAINEGLDVKIIDGVHRGCIKLLVPKNSPIKTVKDLKGKKVGVDSFGGSAMIFTGVLLGEAGIDAKNGVEWIVYPLDQLEGAADRGEFDAYTSWDPFATLSERKGYRVLSDFANDPIFEGVYCCFLIASGKVLRKNPKLIKALDKAYQKAEDWISHNSAEAAKIIIDKKYIAADDPELVRALLETYEFGSHHRNNTKKLTVKEEVIFFTEKLKALEYLPKNLDTKKFVDNVYYDINQ
ncbi:MAG: ABC transporter substrate-binding protein [Elusimicrobiota bacterium]|jgi:NitT/TauT family transport system substrate-binding protein|nr:ABC transporter substrate-binding protein [Elusimicrobiota bacterium]